MTPQKNTLEWMVFSASVVLIAAVVGVLVYAAVTSEGRPPSVSVTSGSAIAAAGGFAVPLDIRNDGDTTAEDVQIEVTLTIGSEKERGSAVLPFVPHRSHRRAWVTFKNDPGRGTLDARVVGYREP